jgi:hypothetical protein
VGPADPRRRPGPGRLRRRDRRALPHSRIRSSGGTPIEDDIAAVAERALLDDGHQGAAHRLTGPEAISNAGQVEAIGRAVGRELQFVEVPPDQAGPELFPFVPPHMVKDLLKAFEATVGVQPEITDAAERITGTPARGFARWAADHADHFRH